MKILLVGSTGHLGGRFKELLSINTKDDIHYLSRNHIKLLYQKNCLTCLESSYDLIINCVGIVGKNRMSTACHEEMFLANILLPYILACSIERNGGFLIHFSSNSIFDSSMQKNRTIHTHPFTNSIYGQTKLLSEHSVSITLPENKYLIIRTPQQYSEFIDFPRNLLSKLITNISQSNVFTITRNEIFSIAHVTSIAKLSLALFREGTLGIVHMAEKHHYSWSSIVHVLVKTLGLNTDIVSPCQSTPLVNMTLEPSYFAILPTELENTVLKIKHQISSNPQ